MTVMMSDELYHKMVHLIRVVADSDNWDIEEIREGKNGPWVRNESLWVKESYDPQYVAQDLLDQLDTDDD